LIISSKWVLPITSPPIKGGAVCITDDRITCVGSRQEVLKENPREEVLDFGESVILPGLVNCHTYLRDMLWRGTIDNHNFISWAKAWANISHKMPRKLTTEELQNSCRVGLCEAIRSGTTCIADVSSHGVSLKPLIESKVRGICFIEAYDQIGTLIPEARSPRKETENVLEETRKDVINAIRICKNTLIDVGVGPHAPYSASLDLIKGIAKMAREFQIAQKN